MANANIKPLGDRVLLDEDIPPFGFAFFTVYQSSNFTIGGKK